MKILIVDDSLQARKDLDAIIKDLGHEVTDLAKDGYEAIMMYKEKKPDLVTMDVTMPKVDGITALEEIIAYDNNAKIIMMTANNEEDLMFEAFEKGALYYLLKPLSKDRVENAIIEVSNKQPFIDEAKTAV